MWAWTYGNNLVATERFAGDVNSHGACVWRCLSDDANWCCCEKFVRVDEETEKKNLFLIGQLGKCRVTKVCSKLDVLNPKCYYLFLKGKSSFLTVNSPSKTTEFSVQLLFDFNTPVGTASQLPFFFFFTVFLHLLFSFFLFFFFFFLVSSFAQSFWQYHLRRDLYFYFRLNSSSFHNGLSPIFHHHTHNYTHLSWRIFYYQVSALLF